MPLFSNCSYNYPFFCEKAVFSSGSAESRIRRFSPKIFRKLPAIFSFDRTYETSYIFLCILKARFACENRTKVHHQFVVFFICFFRGESHVVRHVSRELSFSSNYNCSTSYACYHAMHIPYHCESQTPAQQDSKAPAQPPPEKANTDSQSPPPHAHHEQVQQKP